MAKTEIKADLKLDFQITLQLSLAEARALNAIVGCNAKSFLEVYNKNLGESYVRPYESAIHSLFETVQSGLPGQIHKADKIIKAVEGIKNI